MSLSQHRLADLDSKLSRQLALEETNANHRAIEWIKGLLAVPFVLYSQPTGVFQGGEASLAKTRAEAHRRYSEILRDVEAMIDEHSKLPVQSTLSIRTLTRIISHNAR